MGHPVRFLASLPRAMLLLQATDCPWTLLIVVVCTAQTRPLAWIGGHSWRLCRKVYDYTHLSLEEKTQRSSFRAFSFLLSSRMTDSRAIVRKRARKQPLLRKFEFNVISAQDLRNARRYHHTMRTYVVAYVSQDTKVRTHTDEEGGNNPSWNEMLSLYVEERLFEEDSGAQLTFDIYCHAFFRDKLVGTVRIPVADAVKPNRSLFPITSYVVFAPDGDSHAILNICVPPGGKFPKRLDSLNFRKIRTDQGVLLEAVPSFRVKQSLDEEAEEAAKAASLETGGSSQPWLH